MVQALIIFKTKTAAPTAQMIQYMNDAAIWSELRQRNGVRLLTWTKGLHAGAEV